MQIDKSKIQLVARYESTGREVARQQFPKTDAARADRCMVARKPFLAETPAESVLAVLRELNPTKIVELRGAL